jgi:hypothetical protein
MSDWRQDWKQLGEKIGGTDQWIRRWSVMFSAKRAGGLSALPGLTPGEVAKGFGDLGPGAGMPTSEIAAGTGFVVSSDDQPMGIY